MLEKIEGMIIKTQDYGETNRLITIFSGKLGKFSAIAKGAKKPKSRMAAVTQPFILGHYLVYVTKGLSNVQQGEVINSFRPIREDIVKTAYASYLAELVDKLLESKTVEPYIYDQFIKTMEWIQDHEAIDIPIMMFELKLYGKAGFAPIVNHCVQCGEKNQLAAFSVTHGGVLCSRCKHIDDRRIELVPSLIRLLQIFANVGIDQIGNISVKEENVQKLRMLLDLYYDQYGGFYLKTRKFLKSLDAFK
ncbi:MAG TPA: DNA repair protein RecO [Candidatus Avamphibacillus intestinigallinarum]|nr:DNA repair protein RecO [Candidatus Avamphibacillus intestinigallinarum]